MRRAAMASISFLALVSPQPSRSASVLDLQAEDVGRRAHQLVFPERLHVFLAHALDVERVARHEMAQALDRLRRADEPAGAAPRRLALLAHREAVADAGTGAET